MPDLTVDEAAKLLRVNAETVRRLCRMGRLPGAYRVGIQWRVNRDGLDRLRGADRLEDSVLQAEKLLAFVQRGGDPARWWRSKDFGPAMRQAIQRELERRGGREGP